MEPEGRKTSSQRNGSLDAVRAAAIALVMLHHGRHAFPRWMAAVGERGYFGVDLFFVLSGWLIGGQLLRKLDETGGLELRDFWTRRWLRTLPVYYVIMGFLCFRGKLGHPISEALFLQNYVAPQEWVVTWSLCVEEHFYVLLPLIIWFLSGKRRVAFVAALGFLVLSPALRLVAYPTMSAGTFDQYQANFYGITHLRLDGLVVGVLFAVIHHHLPALWSRLMHRRRELAAAGALLIVTAAAFATDRMSAWSAVGSFFFVSLGVGFLIPFSVSVPRFKGSSILTPIAEHAYTLYLTHGIAYALALRYAPRLGAIGMIVAAAAFAFALRELVEKPGLRLRDRLARRALPARTTSLAA